MTPPLLRLHGALRDYAWGSRRFLAELTGRPAPTAAPEAELWFGAHPTASSEVELPGGARRPLDVLLAEEPVRLLGADLADRCGPRLPFLLKLLAAAEPLSLQVHPSAELARAGFDAEEVAGVPRTAAHRRYPDPWPKPELLVALTRIDALCGFRDAAASAELLDALEVRWLRGVRDRLARDPGALRTTVGELLTLPGAYRPDLVAAVAAGCEHLAAHGGSWAAEAGWGLELARRYPDDPGVVVALLLELVHLEPGEGLHLAPGVPHAYLRGAGVELMGASDNVLRGGLTVKHVDVAELLRVLDVRVGAAHRVGEAAGVDGERVRPTPTAEFRLSELRSTRAAPVDLDDRGPEVLLCTAGAAEVHADGVTVSLTPGQAVFVAATAAAIRVAGDAEVARATVGDVLLSA